MFCPVCKESMIVLELHEIEIDYCTKCEGIWLDEGELEALLENSKEKEELLNSIKIVDHPAEKPHKCPVCSKRMLKINIGGDEKVMIDQCKNGHGFWFDKGELYDIIKAGSTQGENKVLNFLKEMFDYKLK